MTKFIGAVTAVASLIAGLICMYLGGAYLFGVDLPGPRSAAQKAFGLICFVGFGVASWSLRVGVAMLQRAHNEGPKL